jgi:class 3 adenylate cyclase/tetratricopeptide (TPR) repeat protein
LLTPRARFCPNCGVSLTIDEASERRVVSVVFVDLTGSTELAAHLDPERFREVLAAFHQMVSDEVASLGGRTEAFIGDAVMGVFGIPVVHDDDALRAVRAGLSIIEGAGRLGSRLGLPVDLAVRVGIRTGQVAVGTASDRNMVIGAEVNLGARVQQAASPGEILVGEVTHELTKAEVEYGQMRRVEAKGIDEELRVWPVRGLTRKGGSTGPPFVDRQREIALLKDTFDRAEELGRAHLVTLLGEPGIGKSRIVQEFVADLPRRAQVLTGRSSPFAEERGLSPLAQMLHQAMGLDPEASRGEVRRALEQLVPEWVDAQDFRTVTRRLGLVLGLDSEPGEPDRYSDAEARSGFLSVLSALAKDGPLVLVFEDLEDADTHLLEAVQQLVSDAREIPLLVVCVARWELMGELPDWAGGIADAVTLWVEPLPQAPATELAAESGIFSDVEAERVAAHTGGNPFFIVEMASMLRRKKLALPPSGPVPTAELLPPTVQAVVAARLDHLSHGARELVRRASVFPMGRFELDELEMVVEPRNDWLAEAQDEELLIPEQDGSARWAFRSNVLRDVAYDSLAKRERQRLHLRVANKLSSSDRANRYPRTIAFHIERAALASLDLNPRDRTLADRAIQALTHAGELARKQFEPWAVADLYGRALALCGPEGEWGGREAWILSLLGESHYWLGEYDSAEIYLERALKLAGEGDDRVNAHAARYMADIALTIRGDGHAAQELFDRSLEAARRVGDPYVLSRSLLMAGWVPFWRGRLDEAEAMFSEALEVARSGGERDPWAESRALIGLANVHSGTGDEEQALGIALQALAAGEETGQAFTTAAAHETVAASLRRELRLDEALVHAEMAVESMRELGARWELASALGERGAIQRLAGRLSEALRDLKEAFLLCRDLKERTLVIWTAAELARTLAQQGDTTGARAVLDDPLTLRGEGELGTLGAVHMAEAVVELAEGDEHSARARSIAAIEAERDGRGTPNALAAAIWWTGRLFGAEAAGGADVLNDARERLERNRWRQALREPEMVASLLE